MVKQSLFPKAVEQYERRDPIRSLWRNVLLVAMEDAIGKSWRNKNFGSPHEHFRKAAKDYFIHPSWDFMMVCTLAGYNHEYVRMKAKKAFKEEKFNGNAGR